MITIDDVELYFDISPSGSLDDLLDYLIPACEEDYDMIANTDLSVIPPSGYDHTVLEMVGWKLSQRKSLGVQSDRLSDMAQTYEEIVMGYPKSIIQRIKRYVRFI